MTASKRQEILKKVKDNLAKDNKNFTNSIYQLLKEPIPLDDFFEDNPELYEIYEKIGVNPIEEPKLIWDTEETIKNGFSLRFAKQLAKAKDIDLSKYDIDIAKSFTMRVAVKVNGYQDELGFYKKVTAFDNIDLNKINIVNGEEIHSLSEERGINLAKMSDGFDSEIHDKEEFIEEQNKLEVFYSEQMEVKISELLDIDYTELTDWEKELLLMNVFAHIGIINGQSFQKGEL